MEKTESWEEGVTLGSLGGVAKAPESRVTFWKLPWGEQEVAFKDEPALILQGILICTSQRTSWAAGRKYSACDWRVGADRIMNPAVSAEVIGQALLQWECRIDALAWACGMREDD